MKKFSIHPSLLEKIIRAISVVVGVFGFAIAGIVLFKLTDDLAGTWPMLLFMTILGILSVNSFRGKLWARYVLTGGLFIVGAICSLLTSPLWYLGQMFQSGLFSQFMVTILCNIPLLLACTLCFCLYRVAVQKQRTKKK